MGLQFPCSACSLTLDPLDENFHHKNYHAYLVAESDKLIVAPAGAG
jgi:hypothetical protein